MKRIRTLLLCAVFAMSALCLVGDAMRIDLENAAVSSILDDYQLEVGDADNGDDYYDDYFKKFGKSDDKQTSDGASAKSTSVDASGYKKSNAFDKGLKGAFDNRRHKGHYKDHGGRKNNQTQNVEAYNQKDAVINGVAGVNLDEKKSYRKGSKVRGYHRIQHKDEYKKDRIFYDENDASGKISRFGGTGGAFRAGAGVKASASKSGSQFQDGTYDKEGFADRGSIFKELEGFSNSKGFDGKFDFGAKNNNADSSLAFAFASN